MCLYRNERATARLKSRFKNGRIVLYKRFITFSQTELLSRYRHHIFSPGFNKAEGQLYSYENKIGGGAIHVYTTKKHALALSYSNEILIPVLCYEKDFIAAGENNDACFRQIYIRVKDYRKGLKATSKYAVIGK